MGNLYSLTEVNPTEPKNLKERYSNCTRLVNMNPELLKKKMYRLFMQRAVDILQCSLQYDDKG
jgi:hypothetical protein